jgi:hypothetical protein
LARAGKADVNAEDEFRQALAIARRQDAKLLELRALCSLARLRRTSAGEDHREALRALLSGFSEQVGCRDVADARALLACT